MFVSWRNELLLRAKCSRNKQVKRRLNCARKRQAISILNTTRWGSRIGNQVWFNCSRLGVTPSSFREVFFFDLLISGNGWKAFCKIAGHKICFKAFDNLLTSAGLLQFYIYIKYMYRGFVLIFIYLRTYGSWI